MHFLLVWVKYAFSYNFKNYCLFKKKKKIPFNILCLFLIKQWKASRYRNLNATLCPNRVHYIMMFV